MAKEKPKLFYCGKRLNRDDKLDQLFVTPSGQELYYSAIRGVFIGFAYEITMKGKDSLMSKRPKEVDGDEHKDSDKWRALETVAEQRHRKRLTRKRTEKHTDLLANLDAIKAHVKGMTVSQKSYFVEWIVDQIDREDSAKRSADLNARLNRVLKRTRKVDKKKK